MRTGPNHDRALFRPKSRSAHYRLAGTCSSAPAIAFEEACMLWVERRIARPAGRPSVRDVAFPPVNSSYGPRLVLQAESIVYS